MVRQSNRHIVEALRLSRQLMRLANEGETDAEDDGCRVLYGEIRDCAYRIRTHAESEVKAHKRSDIWDNVIVIDGVEDDDDV